MSLTNPEPTTEAISNFPATQPVSGTVTVSNPTTNPETGLAKDATLTGGTQKTKLVDTGGTNVGSISAAGALKVDNSAVTQPVSGTFFQATQPVSLAVNTETNSSAIKSDLDLRFSGGKQFASGILSASGDNVVITPTSGKAVTVFWVALVPSSDNTAANLCQFKFGAAGNPFYTCYAIAHWEPFVGAINQTVIINLTNTQSVAYTIHYTQA